MSKPKPAPSRAAKKPAETPKANKVKALLRAAKGASEADRKRAEALLAEIARRKERIAEDFYDIGKALWELQKKKLFTALGFPSFEDMIASRNVMSLSSAHKLIRIASTLPREKALAIGSEKAALLSSYADATTEPDTPEWLLEHGKLPGGKPVADASTREIAGALKKARSAKTSKAVSPEEVAARRAAREAQAALRKRGAKGAEAEAVKREGRFWLRVELPVDAADLLKGER